MVENIVQVLLVLLSPLPLRLNPLLFLQPLCCSSLSQALPFCSLVGFHIDRRLQSCVSPSAGHNLGSQRPLEIEKSQGSQLHLRLQLDIVRHVDWNVGQLVNAV